ncbi:MAG: membrane protein insertion efficiency factor YidD [Proteobacteria bacterium]|nr:membrane protein insertion efficiency factor YidD [Pseudomonadota bacterium]
MNPFRFRCINRCRKTPDRREMRRPLSAALTFGVLFLVASLLWMQTARADEGLLRGPRKIARAGAESADPASAKPGITEKIAAAPVLFYQRFLGSSWGHRCPSYPSCSNYALLAIREHGAFLGSVMTFDRLQHEAEEVRYSPQILAGGTIKVYDPLENNDYWWYRPARPEPPAPGAADRDLTP